MRAAELWYAFVDETVPAADMARAEALLSHDERERAQRFHFDADRRQFIVAHALARTLLSHCRGGVAPHEWQFEATRYGKPEVVAPAACTDLRFNLSHTRGLAACVVTRGIDVGLDVEARAPRVNGMDLAGSVFAPEEVRALRALPPDARPDAFLAYWTLKEAYVKARGAGLSLPLDKFWFELSADAPPRIVFAPGMQDDERAWQFGQFRLSDQHWMAVALARGRGRDVPIACRRLLPGALSEPRPGEVTDG